MKKFGKPGTVVPRWARGLPSQWSARQRPSRPRTIRPTGMSTTWKPVPNTSASTSISRPRGEHDRVLADLLDAVGHQLDVVAGERRIPVVGRQDPLAADRVVGRRLLDQLGVAQRALAGAVRPDLLEQLHALRLLDEAEHQQLAAGVDRAAHEPLERRGSRGTAAARRWSPAARCAASPTAACAGSRTAARRRARSPGRTGSPTRRCRCSPRACPSGRRRGPSARSGTPGPGSARGRGSPGSFGSTSGPVPEISTFAVTSPWLVSIRQRCAASSQPAPRTSVSSWIFARTPKSSTTRSRYARISGCLRVGARPVRVGRERERVQVRRHVARAAGIRVVVPRPADAGAALEHDVVLDALLAQADRQSDARRSRCRRWRWRRPYVVTLP